MKRLYETFANRRALSHVFAAFAMALFVFSFVSAVAAEDLKTSRADASEVDGTFMLMLIGCTSASDLNNIAILKKEEEDRSFEITSPYGTEPIAKSGLSGMDALAEADNFLGCNVESTHTQLSKIVNEEGTIVGFEVRPQYTPAVCLMRL